VLAFIGRRLGTLFVILFGSSFILYNLTAISGDPRDQFRFSTDEESQAALRALVRQLDLDTPPPLRYFKWLKGVVGLFYGNPNFGLTRDNEDFLTRLAAAIPTTLKLVTAATLTAILLGIALGIVTALRQYSRFDYVVTFFSFLMFSLPIFWVAVLLKQFLAIEFNDFLAVGYIDIKWRLIMATFAAIFWAGVLGGSRARLAKVAGAAFMITFVLLSAIVSLKWFYDPSLGPIVVFLLSLGIAFAVTAIFMGIDNRPALKSSISIAVITLLLYYPLQYIFDKYSSWLLILILAVLTIGTATLISIAFAKIDRGSVIRTTILTSIGCGFIVILDRLLSTWKGYLVLDGVNGRPIPTVGQIIHF